MRINTIVVRGDKNTLCDFINDDIVEFYDDTEIVISGGVFNNRSKLTTLILTGRTGQTATANNNPNLVHVEMPLCDPIQNGSFNNCRKLEEVDLRSAMSVGNNAFQNDIKLQSNNVMFEHFIRVDGVSCFEGCTGLVNLNMLNWTKETGTSSYTGDSFQGCSNIRRMYAPILISLAKHGKRLDGTSLEIFRIPSYTVGVSGFVYNDAPNLKLLDFGLTPELNATAENYCVRRTKILILRKTDEITTLANSTAFTASTTPTPIRVFVPSTLKSSYEAGTNWSTALANGYVTFHALEGTRFEQPNFDDTAIYNANKADIDDLIQEDL